jgi:hypothetical protein
LQDTLIRGEKWQLDVQAEKPLTLSSIRVRESPTMTALREALSSISAEAVPQSATDLDLAKRILAAMALLGAPDTVRKLQVAEEAVARATTKHSDDAARISAAYDLLEARAKAADNLRASELAAQRDLFASNSNALIAASARAGDTRATTLTLELSHEKKLHESSIAKANHAATTAAESLSAAQAVSDARITELQEAM